MMQTIRQSEMERVLRDLFVRYGLPEEKADLLASVHTANTLYGVNSHGIDRVPRFISYVKKGLVKIDAEATIVESFGSIERWDGQLGSGVSNAITYTTRAVELAQNKGMGLVALSLIHI